MNQACLLKYFIQLAGTHYLLHCSAVALQEPTSAVLQYLTKDILFKLSVRE